MAQTKTITVLAQTQNNVLPQVAVNLVVEAVISNNRLTAGHKVDNPGVFTAGTIKEGTATNPQP